MKANDAEITRFLTDHPAWELDQEQLYRQCRFKDFATAFGFMTQVAIIAEKQDHHPDWKNSYRTVDIWLTTHEFKGISERDFKLAKAIDTIADSLLPS